MCSTKGKYPKQKAKMMDQHETKISRKFLLVACLTKPVHLIFWHIRAKPGQW